MKMKKTVQSGFTLIELVMVIVILGVLAAVAIPKFVDLSSDAKAAALSGVVGSINSASSVNYAARSASQTKGVVTASSTCDAAITGILQGGLPAGYTADTSATSGISGAINTCTITQTSGGAIAVTTVISVL